MTKRMAKQTDVTAPVGGPKATHRKGETKKVAHPDTGRTTKVKSRKK